LELGERLKRPYVGLCCFPIARSLFSQVHARCPGVLVDEWRIASLTNGRLFSMACADFHEIKFQCPKCGHELRQTIGRLKASEHMICPGCGIGINIDTNRLANATEEIQKAIGKVPPEITIKFFR
jgi:hypothetical protein